MRPILAALTLTTFLTPAMADEIWVTNEKDDTVSVIDVATQEVIQTYPTGEQYGFAVAEGNTELRDALNAALAGLRDDGTYDDLYAEYFEA